MGGGSGQGPSVQCWGQGVCVQHRPAQRRGQAAPALSAPTRSPKDRLLWTKDGPLGLPDMDRSAQQNRERPGPPAPRVLCSSSPKCTQPPCCCRTPLPQALAPEATEQAQSVADRGGGHLPENNGLPHAQSESGCRAPSLPPAAAALLQHRDPPPLPTPAVRAVGKPTQRWAPGSLSVSASSQQH